jgi:hypothetical protein
MEVGVKKLQKSRSYFSYPVEIALKGVQLSLESLDLSILGCRGAAGVRSSA